MPSRRFALFVAVIALSFALFGCGAKEYPAELLEAKAAVAESAAEGADDMCPEEFKSAETALAQAEAYYAEDEEDEMMSSAQNAISLAETAKNCAIAKKESAPLPGSTPGALPEELAGYTETIFFAYNDNGIRPDQVQKLLNAASYIKQMQDQYKFWVVLAASADRPGQPKENYELTLRRGVVTRFFLIDQGVDPERILIKPLGEAVAAREDKKDVKNQEFRKVEISFLPPAGVQSVRVAPPFLYPADFVVKPGSAAPGSLAGTAALTPKDE
ncbi:OmpA family protein [bacterium]|nr:OmpA family protein [bacterium]